jgi:transcriptional regulator with XRE-family HTH domain
VNDKKPTASLLGQQIRDLRLTRGWTLAELARRAGTSAPTLHKYENGWDRFELDTLRRIGAALGARLEVQLIPAAAQPATARRPSTKALVRTLTPLFWDRPLRESDLATYAGWVLERVLTYGNHAQVRAARAFFGDEAVRSAARRRGVDPRTRQYWRLMLGGRKNAS